MLARAKPGEAYRQSNFDVRLMASDRDDLVLICLDDLIENLGVLIEYLLIIDIDCMPKKNRV